MITDTEFLVIRNFDRNLREQSDASQAVIDRQHRALVAAHAEIVRLRAALATETGKRRHLELQALQGRRH